MRGRINEGKADGVTLRAVLLGFALIPLNVYYIVQWETVWVAQFPTTLNIFYTAIFCLLLVISLNLLLKKLYPKSALTQGELLTIYIVLSTGISVSSHDYTQSLFGSLGACRWFATPENEWSSLFWRYLPSWLTVNDESVLRGFYMGESSLYTSKHIMGWLRPMFWWTIFLTVVIFIMICLNVIVRRRWIEHEKLTYPLVQMPFEMTRENSSGFFRSRLLWIGFFVAAGINLVNGLNFLYPAIPQFPLRYNLGEHFTDRPWNSMGSFLVQINPYAIGLAFPIPLELLFSCWFFFLIWKAESVFGSIMGISISGYPFQSQQTLGACLGISIVALWIGRKEFRHIIGKVFGLKLDLDDSKEPMSYRAAILGVILGMTFLLIFLYEAGMSVWFALGFFLIYFIILFAYTRMRAELGPPLHGISYSGPLHLILAILGSRKVSLQTLTVAAPFWTLTKEIRCSPMPIQLESFKLADRARMNTKRLWKIILLSSFVSILITFWAFLQANYKIGGVSAWRGESAYAAVERWGSNLSGPDTGFLIAVGIGSLIVFINTVLRLRFLWWPLHPIGYPLAGYGHFEKLWFPFFIGWVSKRTILRYGGMRAYRKAFPLFIGFVLGEFTMGSIWGVLGLFTGRLMYAFKVRW